MARKAKNTTKKLLESERPRSRRPATSIKPLLGYVLIESVEAESKTSSGIILPTSAQEKPSLGTVLAIPEPSPVKVGDQVFYKKWGAEEIKVDGKDLKLVKFEDLIAILDK